MVSPNIEEIVEDNQGADQEKAEFEDSCKTPRRSDKETGLILKCPPAPRKPRLIKKTRDPPLKGFFIVPVDLSSVFFPISERPRKRIRSG